MKIILSFLVLTTLTISCNHPQDKKATHQEANTKYSLDDTIGAHHVHELIFNPVSANSESEWDRVNNIVHTSKDRQNFGLDSNYRTFGWHLYSHGSAYQDYNFSLLWGIAYFAYIIDPASGSYKDIHQWKTTALIDSAKVHDCKVFLTVGNFGSGNNEQFLSNPEAQETLIDSVLHLLSLREANGINIDFESVPTRSRAKLSEFVIRISQKLKETNPDYMVSICLYAVDYHKVFDIEAMNPHIDFYTLMGYDYYGGFSAHAGPVAPLHGSRNFGVHCLETSVDYYVGLGVSPSKLIVGLPHYGAEWTVQDTIIASKADKFNTHIPYKTIKEKYIDSLEVPLKFDSLSMTTYCNIRMNEHQYQQLWFDDVTSLSAKYDWVKSKKLGGVGIWALGFDNGHPEMWELLREKFGEE